MVAGAAAKKMKLNDEQKEFLKCKLSRLLELALKDLAKCERSKKYEVDMGWWIHSCSLVEHQKPICYVCLGGAALSQRFGVNMWAGEPKEPDFHDILDGYSIKASDRAYALNACRTGDIRSAFEYLKMRKPKGVPEFIYDVPAYDSDKKKFKRKMRDLIKILADAGA